MAQNSETTPLPQLGVEVPNESYDVGYGTGPPPSYAQLLKEALVAVDDEFGNMQAGIQASLDGHVVPVSENTGIEDAVAVDSSSNPFNEAREKLTFGRGALLLPPDPVPLEDGNPAVVKQGVSVIGWGMGNGQVGNQRASTIQQTVANTDVLRIDDSASIRNGIYRDFHVQGPTAPLDGNAPDTGAGVHIASPIVDCEFTRIRATHLVNNGAIKQTAGITGSKIGHLSYGQVDCGNSGALMDFSSAPGWAWEIGMVDGYGTDTVTGQPSTALDIGKIMAMNIGTLNLGGYLDKAVNQYWSEDGNLNIGIINCEPHANGDKGYVMPEVVRLVGGRPVTIGQVSLRTAKAETIYRLESGFQSGRNDLGMVNLGEQQADVTTGAIVSVDEDMTNPSLYRGVSADVANNTGAALTQGVACLGDLTMVN